MAISEQQAFALVDRVFKHLTSQLKSSPSIERLKEKGKEKGLDEFLPEFQKEITTAILVNGCVDKHKAMVFFGLDNIDDLYLFLIYCKRFNEDFVLWERYIETYYPPFDPNKEDVVFDDKKFQDDGKNKFLNTTWVSLLYYLANEDSELTSELENKSRKFFPRPEPKPEPEPEPESELEPEPELEHDNESGKLVPANSLVPDSSPSKEEKAGWYGIVDAMLGLANVFSALYSMVPIVIKKIEYLAASIKPEKKSTSKSDAAVVLTSPEAATAVPQKTTADSQNIFSLFGSIGSAFSRAFSLTVVGASLVPSSQDNADKAPQGPSPAA